MFHNGPTVTERKTRKSRLSTSRRSVISGTAARTAHPITLATIQTMRRRASGTLAPGRLAERSTSAGSAEQALGPEHQHQQKQHQPYHLAVRRADHEDAELF